jgi:hypothetical protein
VVSEVKVIYDEASRFDDGTPVRPQSGMLKVANTEQEQYRSTGRAGGKTAAASLPVLPRPRRVVLPMSDERRLASYGWDVHCLTPAQHRRYKHKRNHQLALDGKPFGEQKHLRPEGSVSSGNVTTWRAPSVAGGGTLKWGEKAVKGLDRIASLNPFRHRGR